MKTPYIRINQRNEVFFLAKFNASEIKNLVEFHFRDPYLSQAIKKEKIDIYDNEFINDNTDLNYEFENRIRYTYDRYINSMEKKGIELKYTGEGIQRKIESKRIMEIKDFFANNEDNFLANSVLLSIDITNIPNYEEMFEKYQQQETGYFEFNDNIIITIIDGQHRLAGLFMCDEETLAEIEIPAVVIFNASMSTSAKLFSNINGKQKPVSKSVIYDLSEHIIDNSDKEVRDISKLHLICQYLYSNTKSPLYRHIKMLGIGDGAISQAFFIEYVRRSIQEIGLLELNTQIIYEELFYYFKAYQRVFDDYWPVKEKYNNIEEFKEYSKAVLKKSQLLKTTGFGAILYLFPVLYMRVKEVSGKEKFQFYIQKLEKLKKIKGDIFDTKNINGTGIKNQIKLFNEILNIIEKN